MQSDVDVFKARAQKAIQELTKLKNTRQDLDYNLRALNARRDDLKTKRSAELRHGKEIRREVENWLNDVERIKEEVQNNEGLIRLLCAPENIVRIVEAMASETSSSTVSHAGDAAFYGVGGIGINNFNLDRSNITTTIGEVTNHHYYNDKGTK